MKTPALALILACGICMPISGSLAEQKKLSATATETANFLEAAAQRTFSLETFGQGTVQQALREAAAKVRQSGNATGPFEVTLHFTVSKVQGPGTPSPVENYCWNVCGVDGGHQTFLQCYIDCSAPPIPGLK